MWLCRLARSNEGRPSCVSQGEEEISTLCSIVTTAHSHCYGCLLHRRAVLAAQEWGRDQGGVSSRAIITADDMTAEPTRALRTVLTKHLFGSRWSARRLLRRPPDVVAIFSFRYDAHLVPDLIENLRPIVDGFIAYDDRDSTTPYTDERQRKATLLQAARDMRVRWVLLVDPDERLERAASSRMPMLTSGIAPVIWKFRLREMYTPQAYRADGIWKNKRVSCLFPLLEGQVFSDWLLHGQRAPLNPEYEKRDSGLNLYHLKMIGPERRVARRDLYKALDPYNAYQMIGYDYLADETGVVLKKVSSSREYRPLHRETGGLWQVDLEAVSSPTPLLVCHQQGR